MTIRSLIRRKILTLKILGHMVFYFQLLDMDHYVGNMPIDPLHVTSQGARGGLHWRTTSRFLWEKCIVAAFATCLQGTRASVFLIVAVCWTTRSKKTRPHGGGVFFLEVYVTVNV